MITKKTSRVWFRRVGALALSGMLIAATTQAGNRSGTVSGQFLKIPTSARGIGIGGAQVALAEGTGSIGFNPSGIVTIERYGFSGTYTQWFADIKHSFVGGVVNLGDYGFVAVSLTSLATDDMEVTTPAFPEGTGQYFRASDYAFGLTYARRISDEFAIGLTAKYIQSYLYNTTIGTSSMAFDVGTIYNLKVLRTQLGMSLTNLGNDMTFIDEAYSLPTALRFGVAVTVFEQDGHELVASAQVARPNDADEQYNTGAEYVFNETIALRAGYKIAYDAENYAGGFGVFLNVIGLNGRVDYGYNNFKWLPGTHSFSLELGF